MSSGISGQQLQAPLILTWPARQATYNFTGEAPHSGVVFTAVEVGIDGNDINVNVEAALQTEPLSVEVAGTTITIRPETSGSFDSLSTALEMMNAVNADPEASLLVLGTLAEGSNGSGIVEDGEWDHDLTGGLDAGNITFPAFFAADGQILGVGLDGNTLIVDAHENTFELTGDVTGSGAALPGSITATLADTAVEPGTYTRPEIIIDSKGRITGAQSIDSDEHRLATVADVDLNTATATPLFTPPADKTCYITKVVMRNASTSLTTASVSFGWNSPDFNNVVNNATHTEMNDAIKYTILSPKVGAEPGESDDDFSVVANTLQGAPATVDIDVFGYLLGA